MAESWSTSRQAIVVSEEAFTFPTDRSAVAVAAKRTYIERSCITAGYIFSGTSRWSVVTPIDPEHSDVVCQIRRVAHGYSDIQCVCQTDSGVIYCLTRGVDDNGPVVLEYPKYYNDPTIPPDFDIVFRIYSSAPLDWSSFTLTVTTSSGGSASYGHTSVTKIEITPEITEVRLIPSDLLTILGDTVNVKVFIKDNYGRDIDLNW